VIKVECVTRFDITNTGVTGHFKSSRVPFADHSGHKIIDQESWDRARNQQRNWETVTQIISLRTQIFELTEPVKNQDHWQFEFSVETPSVFGTPGNPVAVLIQDSHHVPMLNNLDNMVELPPNLISSGQGQNIWFTVWPINKE
jgi:hypothetical protein